MKKVIVLTFLATILVSFPILAQHILAAAKKDGKWGFIDEKGKFAIEPKFDNVMPFREGLAAANEGFYYDEKDASKCQTGKWGFIDLQGNWVVPPQFEAVENFTEGYAKVNVGAMYRNYRGITLMGGKWGFIDKTGNWFIQPNDTLYTNFSEGYCAFKVPKGSKWGYINQSNKVVIQPIYWEVSNFSQGVAAVMQDDFSYIYIDKSGKKIFSASYKKAYPFHQDQAFVKESTGLPVFINARGEYSFKVENLIKDDNLRLGFSENLVKIPVETANGPKIGFAEKNGKWKINPTYELADDFHNGLALVFADRFYRFIDTEGKIVFKVKDQYVSVTDDEVIFKKIPHPNVGHFNYGYCRLKDGNKWGFIDKTGNFAVPAEFEDLKDFTAVL